MHYQGVVPSLLLFCYRVGNNKGMIIDDTIIITETPIKFLDHRWKSGCSMSLKKNRNNKLAAIPASPINTVVPES